MKVDLTTLNIEEARKGLKTGAFTALDLYTSAKAAIEKNKDFNVFLEVFSDGEVQARAADERLKKGEDSPLLGIPVAIKDNLLYKGHRAGSASKILEGYTAPYDGTVVRKLLDAGAIIVGRTNMDEFAMGSSGENSAYGGVKNPIDPTRVPGGSSSGSAVSVAIGGALVSLGSDTGGSIRQPAALTGIVGFKPTYGQVSRYGLMAMASSLDQIGPFAKTVEDAQKMFHVVKGFDPMDGTSVPNGKYTAPLAKKHYKIGVPDAFVRRKGIDPDVLERFDEAIVRLKSGGHTVTNVDLSSLNHALPVYYIVMPAEVSSNLARFDGIRYGFSKQDGAIRDVYDRTRGEGFGPEVRRRILLGTYVLSSGYYDAYYDKANLVRRLIQEDLKKTFESFDLILTPTTPTPAFPIGEKAGDPLQMYLADIFTVPANIAGVPAISIPMGTVLRDGIPLPVGAQLMAPMFHDEWCFDVGKVIEKN